MSILKSFEKINVSLIIYIYIYIYIIVIWFKTCKTSAGTCSMFDNA
jgi:hypothetical protein